LVGSNALLLAFAWAVAPRSALASEVAAVGLAVGLVVPAVGLLPAFRGGRLATTAAVTVAIGFAAMTVAAAATVGAAVAYVPAVLYAAYFGSRSVATLAALGCGPRPREFMRP
jgi:hypothetical protein